MDRKELKIFLDEKVEKYNSPEFISHDPIQIPHQFTDPDDIAIAAFLSATIAWGNRKSIINNAEKLMALMDREPKDFVLNHTQEDLNRFDGFVHRTFNEKDARQFMVSLKHIFKTFGNLENAFTQLYKQQGDLQKAIAAFKTHFFEPLLYERTKKHVSDPERNSSAKRLNMYLRWMVRRDKSGVDFGLWEQIKMSDLSLPLDVHTGRVARKLGLLSRKQNDAKAVKELDGNLIQLDPHDPVKYDFALFGLGAFEDF